jgi:hypothetical protein
MTNDTDHPDARHEAPSVVHVPPDRGGTEDVPANLVLTRADDGAELHAHGAAAGAVASLLDSARAAHDRMARDAETELDASYHRSRKRLADALAGWICAVKTSDQVSSAFASDERARSASKAARARGREVSA